MASASFFFVLSSIQTAHATQIGRAVYGWGQGESGQQGNNAYVDVLAPEGIPQLTALHAQRGIYRVYAGIEHTIAITADGHVYTWGRGDSGQLGNGGTANVSVPTLNTQLTAIRNNHGIAQFHMGQWHQLIVTGDNAVYAWGLNESGQIGNNSTANVLAPTEIPALTDLIRNRGAQLHVATFHGLAITSDGYVYGWGDGRYLGRNDAADVLEPTEIPVLTNLVQNRGAKIVVRERHNFAFTADGHVYGWGSSARGYLGNNSTALQLAPVEIQQITTLIATRDIAEWHFGVSQTFAFATDGTVYVWGTGQRGQLGNGVEANVLVPTVSQPLTDFFAANNIVKFHVPSHVNNYIAITDDDRAYVWGLGRDGRLGHGSTDDVLVPTEVPAISDLAAAGAQFFMGGRFTFALDPVEPILVSMRKTLQMPEGTTPPSTATFYFQFTPTQIQLTDTPPTNSRPVSDFPSLTPNPVPITLSGIDATTANTVTMVSTLNLMDVFSTIVFPGGGVFVWNVHEIPGSSQLTDLPNFEVLYDDSRYQIRVHATTAGTVGAIEVFELNYVPTDQWVVGDKVEELNFLNTYRRLTGLYPCPDPLNGIEITKNVVGEFADLSTEFSFTLTLTEHFLAPLTFPISAYRIPVTGAPIPVSITSATTTNITLRHGESFVIPQIWAGTNFAVTEAAQDTFAPSVSVIVGGVQVHTASAAPNTALSTGNHIVWDTGRNAADYTNTHQHIPPTGLFITSTPLLALVVTATLLLALLISNRNRKRIEELPLVF